LALPRQLNSGQVLIRFAARILLLAVFATFGSIGFARSLIALLWMAIILCVVVGAMRREPPFGPTLNHWDEGAAFAALFALARAFTHISAT
jgi:hypothetical protein